MVVGAGHSGVMIAARLQAMGVRTSSSRNPLGWATSGATATTRCNSQRNLHDRLSLYIFPAQLAGYLPKDMYAAWLEFYATAMELSVWTSMGFKARPMTRPTAAGRHT